ncbi:MAG: lipid-A-disaccharide synthase [Elusimicrobia bacterium]|nr:lipid-A-disaccharide synthase [Elusimicrobiota bacterium]
MPEIIKTNKNILIVAGDASADMHGASLISELKKKDPELSVYAIGGVRMKAVSNHLVYDLVSHGAIGFLQSFKSVALWVKLIKLIRRFLEEKKPLCVIAVDFYGFNHQVLGLCKHRKIPVYYYIPPQVWASRPGRAKTVAELSKEIFAIFPFEPAIYSKYGGRVSFFGHPLLDIIPPSLPKKQSDFSEAAEIKIGILPGSRKSEIERHLPLFMECFSIIKSVYKNASAKIFAVPETSDKRICDLISQAGGDLLSSCEIIRESDYKKRAESDFCLTCSGTATLENALLGIPMITAYIMPEINYQIAKRIIKVPYISLANIILKKPLIKEFVQKNAKPALMAQEVFSLLNNPQRYHAFSAELISVRKILGEAPVAEKIAEKILSGLKTV